MRRPASTFVACAAWLFARAAVAEGAPPHARARIAYERGPDASTCPDDAGFRTELSRQLGYDPSAAEPTRIALEVSVRKTRRGTFEGAVRLWDRGRAFGMRTFDGASCGELVSSMALSIGILLEPFAPAEASAPAAAGSTPTATAPAPALVPPVAIVEEAPAPPPPREPRARPAVALAVGEMQSLGLAPSPSFGLEAIARIAGARWSVDIEGRSDFEASRSAPDGQRVGTSLVAGGASPCLRLSVARACVVALLGAIQGSVSGQGDTQRKSSLFAAVGPRAAVELHVVGPLAVRGHVDLLFPVNRVSLEQGGVELWTTSAVAGSLGFDAVALFP